MQVVSAREFRSNQGKYLNAAKNGQSVLLTSRYGSFKITTVKEDTLTERICHALRKVKLMEDGVLPKKSAEEFLNEL